MIVTVARRIAWRFGGWVGSNRFGCCRVMDADFRLAGEDVMSKAVVFGAKIEKGVEIDPTRRREFDSERTIDKADCNVGRCDFHVIGVAIMQSQ